MVLVAGLLVVSTAGHAWTTKLHYTKEDQPACLSGRTFDKLVEYNAQGDKGMVQGLFDSERCFFLKGGIPVYVENVSLGIIRVRPKGSRLIFYLQREGID